MRRRLPLALAGFCIPVMALALDFTDVSKQYSDAPFPRPEAAGISVMTHLGAVRGNPDGTFAPARTLNRAEFMKIVWLGVPNLGGPWMENISYDCFPDVHKTDWFSTYICAAKEVGYIQGYPDGLFHPERMVNYAEALKILAKLYQYETAQQASEPWYMPYARAAAEHKTALPIALGYDAALTRGQMCRLTAAFFAEASGELALYRAAESGRRAGSSSSTSSVSSSSQSSTSSIASSSSAPLFPAQSHLLLSGQRTPMLFDGTFASPNVDAWARSVTMTLKHEIKSIDQLYLTDASGRAIATLLLDTNNNADHLRWIADIGSGQLKLPMGQPTPLGFRAQLFNQASGGRSKEMFELDTYAGFSLFVEEVGTGLRKQLFPSDAHNPLSETTQAVISQVRSTLPASGTLHEGKNRTIVALSFTGTVQPGASLKLNMLEFSLTSRGVQAIGWRIGGASEIEQADCGVEGVNRDLISCSAIPEQFQDIGNGKAVVTLYADITVDPNAQDPYMQVRLVDHGKIGDNGDIWWSDGFGDFRWLEPSVVLPSGPKWTVVP